MSTRIGLNRRKLMPAKMQIEKLTDEIVRLNVNNEALQHRAERAEAALEDLVGQVMQGLEANGDLEELNHSPSLKQAISEARKALEDTNG